MGCNCANRMRKYVLPALDFVFHEDTQTWENPEFPHTHLRLLPDAQIENHYTRLTAELAVRYSLDQFEQWWNRMYEGLRPFPQEHYKALRVVYEKQQLGNALPPDAQWPWMLETWVLPNRGYREVQPGVWSMEDHWHVGMPDPVTPAMYEQVREVLVMRTANCYPDWRFLEWWNDRAPAALQMTSEQHADYAARWRVYLEQWRAHHD